MREDDSVRDIAYQGDGQGGSGTILLGRLFLKQRENTYTRLRKLCHENLHNVGLPHDDKARYLGYFSGPRRDNFSRMVSDRLLLSWDEEHAASL